MHIAYNAYQVRVSEKEIKFIIFLPANSKLGNMCDEVLVTQYITDEKNLKWIYLIFQTHKVLTDENDFMF